MAERATATAAFRDVPVLVSALSATAVAAFFLDYLSPFIDAPAGAYGSEDGQILGVGEYFAFTALVVGAVLFVWTRLGRLPGGIVTAVVAAASVPNDVFNDFEHLPAQLWPLAGAVVADAALRWLAAAGPRLLPVAAGALIPLLVWLTHLIGVELSIGIIWSPELRGGAVVLTTLAGAVAGGLCLGRPDTRSTHGAGAG
ncbi:hypothetical protein [Dactylosporangium sp. CA-092794]|uniref:hypothetical protein n=1 Tax=Dactylosporangium sp. CA-092794 TaxID=3239929 RepID=UPI003D8E6AE3